jgi:hypothetical protein
MTDSMIELPDELRARWSDAPRLAWMLSRATSPVQLPGRFGDLWAFPVAVTAGLPIVLAATLTRQAATRRTRDALLIAYCGRRSQASLWLVTAIWMAATMSAIYYLSVDVALIGVATRAQLRIRVAVGCVMFGAFWVPVLDNFVALARETRRDGFSAFGHARRLRRMGLRALTISAWSTWPAHRQSGRRLADDVLLHLPADVWLVATARNPTVARWLQERGFRPVGQGLLMERPGTPPR